MNKWQKMSLNLILFSVFESKKSIIAFYQFSYTTYICPLVLAFYIFFQNPVSIKVCNKIEDLLGKILNWVSIFCHWVYNVEKK